MIKSNPIQNLTSSACLSLLVLPSAVLAQESLDTEKIRNSTDFIHYTEQINSALQASIPIIQNGKGGIDDLKNLLVVSIRLRENPGVASFIYSDLASNLLEKLEKNEPSENFNAKVQAICWTFSFSTDERILRDPISFKAITVRETLSKAITLLVNSEHLSLETKAVAALTRKTALLVGIL